MRMAMAGDADDPILPQGQFYVQVLLGEPAGDAEAGADEELAAARTHRIGLWRQPSFPQRAS